MTTPKADPKSGRGKAKILIVDDHSVVIEGIKGILAEEQDFEVVGTAPDGLEAVAMIKSLRPDIVILDILMTNLDGIETARQLKQWDETIEIVIFSMRSEIEYVLSLFQMGVSGYVLKGEPLSELAMCLNVVRNGGTFYSKTIQKNMRKYLKESESRSTKKASVVEMLSLREKEVFLLLADGLTPKEIADRLCISPKTVETHKYNIMGKLGAKSVAQLTKIAAKEALITI